MSDVSVPSPVGSLQLVGPALYSSGPTDLCGGVRVLCVCMLMGVGENAYVSTKSIL